MPLNIQLKFGPEPADPLRRDELIAFIESATVTIDGKVGTADLADGAITPDKVSAGPYFFAVDSGVVNAPVANLNPLPGGWLEGMIIYVKMAFTNTIDTPILTVSGLPGTKPIMRADAVTKLSFGDYVVGQIVTLKYSATANTTGAWLMDNPQVGLSGGANADPPGTLRWDAAPSSASVAGWLLCDGASYLKTDYPNLSARIGTAYGSADSTHFNVPDPRGRGLIVAGQGPGLTLRTLGGTGGEETHKLVGGESGTGAHTHSTGLNLKPSVGFGTGGSAVAVTDTGFPAVTTLSNTAVDASTPHENMAPFFGATLWIKT